MDAMLAGGAEGNETAAVRTPPLRKTTKAAEAS